jgi:hypothetical protein
VVRFQLFLRGDRLAKPTYSFEKRQKEIAKKKEEKRLRKASEKAQASAAADGTTPPPAEGETPTQG